MQPIRVLRRVAPVFALALAGAFGLGILSGDPSTVAATNAVIIAVGVGLSVGIVNVVLGRTA